jgi:DNA-binding IclR family transcriptional regulator
MRDGMTKVQVAAPPAPAVAYAVQLLQILRAANPEQLGVSELARRLGLGKASTHRILTTLVDQSCLIFNPVSKGYSLGPALVALGEAASGAADVLQAARNALPALAERSRLTAAAFRFLPDWRLAAVACVNSAGPFQVNQVLGQTFHLIPPVGTLEFAFSSPTRFAEMLNVAKTQGLIKTDLDVKTLEEDVHFIREHGYSWSASLGVNREASRKDLVEWLNGIEKLGIGRKSKAGRAYYLSQMERYADTEDYGAAPAPIFGLAVPVFDAQGRNILHLAVQGFLSQVPPERVTEVAGVALQSAREITAAIGGRQPYARELA